MCVLVLRTIDWLSWVYNCIFRKAVREHFDFRRRCNSFFMELVSLFCFGSKYDEGVMDPELFAMFMSYVIEASSKTKDFSPFPEHGIDATPVVRSFLLQQLLRKGYVKLVIMAIRIWFGEIKVIKPMTCPTIVGWQIPPLLHQPKITILSLIFLLTSRFETFCP